MTSDFLKELQWADVNAHRQASQQLKGKKLSAAEAAKYKETASAKASCAKAEEFFEHPGFNENELSPKELSAFLLAMAYDDPEKSPQEQEIKSDKYDRLINTAIASIRFVQDNPETLTDTETVNDLLFLAAKIKHRLEESLPPEDQSFASLRQIKELIEQRGREIGKQAQNAKDDAETVSSPAKSESNEVPESKTLSVSPADELISQQDNPKTVLAEDTLPDEKDERTEVLLAVIQKAAQKQGIVTAEENQTDKKAPRQVALYENEEKKAAGIPNGRLTIYNENSVALSSREFKHFQMLVTTARQSGYDSITLDNIDENKPENLAFAANMVLAGASLGMEVKNAPDLEKLRPFNPKIELLIYKRQLRKETAVLRQNLHEAEAAGDAAAIAAAKDLLQKKIEISLQYHLDKGSIDTAAESGDAAKDKQKRLERLHRISETKSRENRASGKTDANLTPQMQAMATVSLLNPKDR